MNKYIIQYDETTGMIYDEKSFYLATYLGADLNPYHPEINEGSSDVLELVKQGLTADDFVKLKNMEII